MGNLNFFELFTSNAIYWSNKEKQILYSWLSDRKVAMTHALTDVEAMMPYKSTTQLHLNYTTTPTLQPDEL